MTSKKSYFTVKRIALLSVLTAFVTVGRLGFALPFLPNIQPVTTMIILIILAIGTIDGLVVAVLSLLLSSVFLGMGPWVIMQILSYAVIVLLTALIKPFYHRGSLVNRIVFALWTGMTGLIYGLVISYLSYRFYEMPSLLAYYLNGVYFDLLHGIGNVAFFLILEPIIVPITRQQLRQHHL